MTIFVLNCGLGNVGAISSMYRRMGVRAELIDRPTTLASGDRLILPGVGAFDFGAESLERGGLGSYIRDAAAAGHPVLGICLGMQLLGRGSEEGSRRGLGILPAEVVRLDRGPEQVRVPHMGWNIAKPTQENPLLPASAEEQRFYFTHSYRVRCDKSDQVWATTLHGEEFPSVIGSGKVMGVQFHPEKSHRYGKALLGRFAAASFD